MKKYSFLVYHKQYTDFLEKIREIGVLHVIEKDDDNSENESLRNKHQIALRFKFILKQLEKRIPKNSLLKDEMEDADPHQLLLEIEQTLSSKELLEQQLQITEKESQRMEVWGSFGHQRMQQLSEAGFVINFYSCNIRKFDQEWETKYNAFEIDTIGTTRYFVTINRQDIKIEIDAEPIKLANATSAELDLQASEIKKAIENIKNKLHQMAVDYYSTLKKAQIKILGDIDYSKVILNTGIEASEKLMVLEGWCPEDTEEKLNAFLQETDIYFETNAPGMDEKVPIKLKNNRFAKLFEMIGELYDLPNYHEMDLTPFFAPFFMLFFGLCLGDAGYGFFLLIISIFAIKKVKPALKPILSLCIWLGSATVILGTVSGTFFGYNLLESKISWLESFKLIMLDSNQLFYTALLLGVIQIMFGMIIKAVSIVRRYGISASLSTWGWIIALIGSGIVFGLSEFAGLNSRASTWAYWTIWGFGGIFIFILNDLNRNPLINFGAGLWDLYNMATGLLGDILSYIRLFALGISGAVMGFVFNDLAFKLSGDIPIVSPIIMLLIMFIGHGINIFMSGLSAFVHPMRLTFVEFYKNAGFEGGGKKYAPFAPYKEKESLF